MRVLEEMWIAVKIERDDPWPRMELCGSEEEAKEYFSHHLKPTDRVEYFKMKEVEGTHVTFQAGVPEK